jgi:glycosyltransferase involved in cell wall biosynthesis
MRILMVTDFYPPFLGGVETVVSGQARELAARGHDVSVATLAAPKLDAEEEDYGVHVHRIRAASQRVPRLFSSTARPWAPPAPDPGAVRELMRVVARRRPEIVHGHDWLARSYLPLKLRGSAALTMSLHYYTLNCPKKTLVYRQGLCAGPALRKCLECAGAHYGAAKGTMTVLAQRMFSRAEAALVDLFLPVSRATALHNGLLDAALPFEIVPNVITEAPDPMPYAEHLSLLPPDPFFLFVGDIRRLKGSDVLLDAYSRLVAPPPLVLIGKVWPETPRDLPPGVVLLRDWPNGAVRAAMSRCLALVAPSMWAEPFGMVIAETLAAGRPAVASRLGGIPEIVSDGEHGLLVSPGDAAELAAALALVHRDRPLGDRLGRNGLRRAEAFGPAAIIPALEHAYERALSRRRASTRRRNQRS